MAEKETVTLSVDGIEVTVDKGSKVYDAAVAAGVYLPGLCYDPKLTRFGGCRLCIVDVTARGRTRGKWACCEPANNGVEITTNSPGIEKKRPLMMEFLLMHHPLDCPTCNASGDCGLQDAAFYVKQKKGRLPQERRNEPLLIDNPVIERDFNRCILCGKCVIACDELQGNGAIDFQSRGFESEVGTQFRVPLDCDYCGQCLAVCPTGSFQDHTEQYKGHDWEYDKTATTCPFCAVGCTLIVNTKKGEIAKIGSDDLAGVNNGNLCARGRFGHEAFQSDGRIKTPLVREGVKLDPSTWDDAIAKSVEKINEIKQVNGADSIAVIAGESLTNEDFYILQKLVREGIGSSSIETLSNMNAPTLNSGLFDEFGAAAPITTYDAIDEASSFFFFGCDAEKENPVVANMVRVAMRDNHTPLYVANTRNTLFLPHETSQVRYNYGSEIALLKALEGAICGGDGNLSTAANETGVSEDDIKALSENIKNSGSPLIVMGSEVCDHVNGAEIVKGVANIAKATGGKTLLLRESANSQGANDMGISRSHSAGYQKVDGASSEDIFQLASDGKVKALIIAGADPATFARDNQFAREAIQNTDFVLVTTSHMNETATLADVVLPTSSPVEREGTYANNEGRVQPVRKSVEPLGESKPDYEVFNILGASFGVDSDVSSAASVTNQIAENVAGYAGLTSDKIASGDALVAYPNQGGEAQTFSPNGRVVNIPSDNGYDKLALIGNSLYHLGALSRQSSTLNKIASRVIVEVGYDDAEKEGLMDGDSVVVESKQGKINAKVSVSDKSPAGVVHITKNFENEPALRLVYRNDDVTKVRIVKAAD